MQSNIITTMIRSLNKPVLEVALDRYTTKLVKNNGKYLTYQIDSICQHGTEVDATYAVRARGLCTSEEVISKLESATTELAQKIKTLAGELAANANSESEEFIIVSDAEIATSE
jgi:hypothetical protein